MHAASDQPAADAPILIVPYVWVGDFVRCHSVVRVLRDRFPARPIDVLTNELCAPLLDYMPGVRKGIAFDLPRGSIPLARYGELARRLRAENYGAALIMPRTWKSALAPFLAGIPRRTGFFGEGRFILLNDLRWGERRLERMVDRCCALALPTGVALPEEWPAPELAVPAENVAAVRERLRLPADGRPVAALAPGAIGAGKAWPTGHYAELASRLTAIGTAVWLLGGPREQPAVAEIAAAAGPLARPLITPLREAAALLRAADVAVANDSGLMHVAAALGTPTVAIFGPTSPRLSGPLNPLAAVLEPDDPHHRRPETVSVERVLDAVRAVLGQAQDARTRR